MPISDQIDVSPIYSSRNKSLRFKISGKTPTLVSDGQGDHVTAFALVKRGITRHLENVVIQAPTDLDKTRHLRNKIVLDGYISRVLAIDLDKREAFIGTIQPIQDDYNDQRIENTKIQRSETVVTRLSEQHDASVGDPSSGADSVTRDEIESLRPMVERNYITNAFFMCFEIGEIAKSFLTCYNKIPGVAFEKIATSPAPSKEGANVKKALDEIENIIRNPYGNTTSFYERKREIELQIAVHSEELARQAENSSQQTGCSTSIIERRISGANKKREEIEKEIELKKDETDRNFPGLVAGHLEKLLFYPRVLDGYSKETEELLPGDRAKIVRRDNDVRKFYYAMARHLYIAFSVYPELNHRGKEIIDTFVKLYISKHNWRTDVPTNEEAIQQVELRMKKFESVIESITETQAYRSHSSSFDKSDQEGREEQEVEDPEVDAVVSELKNK